MKNNTNTGKVKKIYNMLIFIVEFIVSLLLAYSVYKISYIKQDYNFISIPYMVMGVILIIIIGMITFCNSRKYNKNVGKMFLTFVIPIGIMYMVMVMPFWNTDEEGHIYKSYDISMGNIITPLGEKKEGDIYVPEELLTYLKENIPTYSALHNKIKLTSNYENNVAVQTPAKSYAPVNYVTGGVAFFVGRVLNINILLVCYGIKMLNFILFLVVGYYSIKIIPFGKIMLSIYMMMPMILQQATSISADAFVNMITILFVAYNLKLLYLKRDLKIFERIIYYLLTAMIAFCKFVYFPIVFMNLLLISNKKISIKSKIKIVVIPIILALIISGCWFMFSQKYVDVRVYIKEAGVSTTEQVKFIIKNPVKFIEVLKTTIDEKGLEYLLTFGGSSLGSADIAIPQLPIIIMIFILFTTPFVEVNDRALNNKQRIWTILIFFGTSLLVLLGLYLTWSPVGYHIVAGVQGRYFIPVVIILLVSVFIKEKYIDFKRINVVYPFIVFLLNIIPIIEIIKNFSFNK